MVVSCVLLTLLHLVPPLTGKGRWCCDLARAVLRQNMVWFPLEGDGHPTIDTDLDTYCKDSYHGMDDHKPYTMF